MRRCNLTLIICCRVCEAVLTLKEQYVCWPSEPMQTEKAFRDIAGFPCVVGAIDGTHIRVNPPAAEGSAFINQDQKHSLNVCGVAGPNYRFYYVHSGAPGRSHDSGVLKQTSIWQEWEENGYRPFDGAVILGDAGYPLTEWLLTPFSPTVPLSSDQEGYQRAHTHTRAVVEQSFGVLKMRFRKLFTGGLRITNMQSAANLIEAAVVIHNMCIDVGDDLIEYLAELPTVEEDWVPQPDSGSEDTAAGASRRDEIVERFRR